MRKLFNRIPKDAKNENEKSSLDNISHNQAADDLIEKVSKMSFDSEADKWKFISELMADKSNPKDEIFSQGFKNR